MDPFEGRSVKPFGGPSAPSNPSPRAMAFARETEALDALGRAHRCWIYPLIAFGIALLFKLVLFRAFGPLPVAWGWVLFGVVVLFLLGGLWRFFAACWNLKKYRHWGFLWPISLGLIVNIPACIFFVAAVGTLVEGVWHRLVRYYQG